jgi:hypothetical protein
MSRRQRGYEDFKLLWLLILRKKKKTNLKGYDESVQDSELLG